MFTKINGLVCLLCPEMCLVSFCTVLVSTHFSVKLIIVVVAKVMITVLCFVHDVIGVDGALHESFITVLRNYLCRDCSVRMRQSSVAMTFYCILPKAMCLRENETYMQSYTCSQMHTHTHTHTQYSYTILR